MFGDHPFHGRQKRRRQGRQGPRLCDLDGVVGRNPEPFQRLFGELGVLAGTQGRHLRMRRKLKNDGRHLDRFGPGSDHAQKSLHPAANSPRRFRLRTCTPKLAPLIQGGRAEAKRADGPRPRRVPRGFRALFRGG